MQNFAPPSYDEHIRPTEGGKAKRCAKIRKWFSDPEKASLFAAASGIIICTVLVVIHIVLLHVGEPIFYFISGLFFLFAFVGLKRGGMPIVLIFLLGEIVQLFLLAIYCVFLLTVLIAMPDSWVSLFKRPEVAEKRYYGCYVYWWPSGNVNCNSDEDLRYIIFYNLLSSVIYLALATVSYWLIWRAYKIHKKPRRATAIPSAPIPAVYNPPRIPQNNAVVPTPDLISDVSSYAQQSQADNWPTFFDHQKISEHEMSVFRSNQSM